MPKKKEELPVEEKQVDQKIPEFDPETQELKRINVFDNGKMKWHAFVVEEKHEKTSDEIISERIIELKVLVAQSTATDQDRDDLRLLLS